MTIGEYIKSCNAQSLQDAIFDKETLATFASAVFSSIFCEQCEAIISTLHSPLELDVEAADERPLLDVNQEILTRTTAAVLPNIARWTADQRVLTLIAGLSADDIMQDRNITRTVDEDTTGLTNTDGTASRNSFNSETLVPVSGSSVDGSTTGTRDVTETERGQLGGSRAQKLMEFNRALAELRPLMQDVVTTALSALVIAVY